MFVTLWLNIIKQFSIFYSEIMLGKIYLLQCFWILDHEFLDIQSGDRLIKSPKMMKHNHATKEWAKVPFSPFLLGKLIANFIY